MRARGEYVVTCCGGGDRGAHVARRAQQVCELGAHAVRAAEADRGHKLLDERGPREVRRERREQPRRPVRLRHPPRERRDLQRTLPPFSFFLFVAGKSVERTSKIGITSPFLTSCTTTSLSSCATTKISERKLQIVLNFIGFFLRKSKNFSKKGYAEMYRNV